MKKLAKELGSSSVSDAEAKKFYNDNISKFKHPDKVRASHILISVNPQEIEEVVKSDPNNKNIDETAVKAKVAAEVQAKEAKANQILAEAKKNPTQFAKLAKENSEDTATANKGGDLGFFKRGVMVKPFEDAAFAMKEIGEVSEPVETQFGWHLIQLTGMIDE